MYAGRLVRPGLEDATPWPWSAETTAPALVACPFAGVNAAAAAELYRIAYERARAAARPSRYGLALGALPN